MLPTALDSSPAELEKSPGPLGRDFSKLWSATAASNLSDGIRTAALPLLAASMTRDPAQVAGVAFAAQAPWLLFGLASGAIVDRYERRRIIGVAHLCRMAVITFLALAVVTDTAGIVTLYLAAFGLGVAETLFDNATQVIVPELVAEANLERANGRQTIALVGGQQLAGPLLGAALFAGAASAPLLLDAAVLAIAAVFVFSIRVRPKPAPPPETTLRRDVADSLRWLWQHRLLRTISVAAAMVNISIAATMAIFVLFALDILHVGEIGYALILGCYAVGGIAGGLLAAPVAARLGPHRAMVAAVATAAGAIAVTGLTSSALVAAAMQAALALAGALWAVVTCTLRQRLAPAGMLGRVTGAHQLLSWGGAAVGALVGGGVAAVVGLRGPFFVAAAMLALVAVGLGAVAVPRTATTQPAAA